MASTLRRVVATAGATALIAGAVIVAAPSAQADGDYYGTWTLTAVTANGQKYKCEGTNKEYLVCPAGKTLTLKTNYRYKASTFVALLLLQVQKGAFVTTGFPGTGDQVLVLEGDATGIQPLGSAWHMVLKDTRSGSPTKMILTLNNGLGEFGFVFQRDAN